MFQERTNINQWIYEQDVDVISHVPAHTKCTWKPFLRSDNPPVRVFWVPIRLRVGHPDQTIAEKPPSKTKTIDKTTADID